MERNNASSEYCAPTSNHPGSPHFVSQASGQPIHVRVAYILDGFLRLSLELDHHLARVALLL